MTGIERIAAERQRQMDEEGWTEQHDDQHDMDELAAAAGCYALHVSRPKRFNVPGFWPWAFKWWKPSEPTVEGKIRDLEKAGALIAAEIDRLQRIRG